MKRSAFPVGARLALIGILLATPRVAHAQLMGFNVRGDAGLKSGTQPAPNGYLTVVGYWYDTNTIRRPNGAELPFRVNVNSVMGAGAFTYVTNKKVLGANYAISATPLLGLNTRFETAIASPGSSPGFGDTAFTPVSLGWHAKRVDVTTAYTLYMPTGRYDLNARGNTGLDMWGHEAAIGSTVYLTEKKTWHAATNAAFEFHPTKRNSAARVGTLLTLEGGVGRDLLGGLASAGLSYTSQTKLSNDTLTGLAPQLVIGKNKTFALGPEVNIPLLARKTLFGVFTFRYQWETFARTSLQGNTMFVSISFLMKPLDLRPLMKK